MKSKNIVFLLPLIFLLIGAGCAKDDNSGDLKDNDGNVYRTIVLGEQVWMAENLKSVTYPDGTAIDLALSYEAIESNAALYGRLYTYEAATKGADGSAGVVQGVCPKGWHLPSDAEWKTLEKFLGMSQAEAEKENWRGTDEGGKLKEKGTAHWTSPNKEATDAFLFTALPAGTWNSTSGYTALGMITYFWSSTSKGTVEAWNRALYNSESRIARFPSNKEVGCSVRCIKD